MRIPGPPCVTLLLCILAVDLSTGAYMVYRPGCSSDEILQKAMHACNPYKRGVHHPGVRTHRTDPENLHYDEQHNSAMERTIVGLRQPQPPYRVPPPHAPTNRRVPSMYPGQPQYARRPRRSNYGPLAPASEPVPAVTSDGDVWSFDDQYVELEPTMKRYLRSPVKIRDVRRLIEECCNQGHACTSKNFQHMCAY